MSNIPEYNQIDIDNDSLVIITAKIEALVKALRQRAENTTNEKEKSYLKNILSKPLIQLSPEAKGEVIEPVEPIPEEDVLGNPGSVLSKPLAEWP